MAGAIVGKYQLIAELGRGGMADVFLAVARGKAGLGFSKLVVIKRLREHLANDADFIAMLIDEARIAARLNHPNVVQMLEIDEADGEYFLAMEYLDGQPLRRILQRMAEPDSKLTKTMQYSIISDVLGGLHHAHELADYDGTPLKVVHRDVTPHNVFVTYDGQVKVVDFGIAKAVGRASETRHGIIKGKVPYMAPEQAAGLVVDRRADIFSVGVMLWEAAVGARMWQDVKEVDILRSLIRGNIPSSPREADQTVSAELDAICRKALARKLEDRYATAQDFQRDLEDAIRIGGAPPTARDIGKVLSDAFADKREGTRAIIEAQLAKLRDDSGDAFRPAKMPQSPPSSSSESLNLEGSGISVSVSEDIARDPTSDEVIPREEVLSGMVDALLTEEIVAPRRPRRRIWLLGVVGLAAVVVLGVAIAAAPGRTTTTNDHAHDVPNPSTPPSSASGGPTAVSSEHRAPPSQIAASFRADPPEARFSVDDAGALPNPYVGSFARDNAKHTVRVFAAGYLSKVESVTFDDDVSLQTSLARDPSHPKKP